MGKGKGKGTPRRNKQQPKRQPTCNGTAALRNNHKMVSTVMHGQSRNVINESFRRGEKQGFSRSLMVTMWVLHEEFGFGPKRMEPFLAELAGFCNEYLAPNTKHVRRGEFKGMTVEDLRDELFDMYGFYINMTTGRMYRVDDKPYDKKELPPEALEESEPQYLDDDFWVSTLPEIREKIIEDAKAHRTTVEDLLEYRVHCLYSGEEEEDY